MSPFSTYDNLCTTVNQMITENWAGIMGDIGNQINTMLSSVGVNASQCPQPARDLHINGFSLTLPSMPSILSFFAAVWSDSHYQTTLFTYSWLFFGGALMLIDCLLVTSLSRIFREALETIYADCSYFRRQHCP